MPKTASKRAQARKSARVQRAHAEAPNKPIVRRVPPARRRGRPRGLRAVVSNYPWATTFFVVLVVGVGIMVAHAQQIGPFAPPKPVVKTVQCDLKTHHCSAAPPMTISTSKTYTATIKTAKGDIVIALDAKTAPIAVNNFVFLADQHYYDGTYFWRVETPGKPSPINPSGGPSPLSLIQGGAVAKNGQDASTQPGYTIKDDKITGDYAAGTVAMANTGQPNTASSQFFIDIGNETQYFSKSYVTFGTVTSGMNVVKEITAGDPIESITITVK